MNQHYVGLDVSLDQTSLCVLDGAGQIVCEAKLDTDAAAIATYLSRAGVSVARLGLEAGPLSQWFHAGLVASGRPATCIETRHTKAVVGAISVNTDGGDARGIA